MTKIVRKSKENIPQSQRLLRPGSLKHLKLRAGVHSSTSSFNRVAAMVGLNFLYELQHDAYIVMRGAGRRQLSPLDVRTALRVRGMDMYYAKPRRGKAKKARKSMA